MGIKRLGLKAFRLEGFLLAVVVGVVVVACNGGGASSEPGGDATQGPGDTDTPAATATPTVSPEPGGGARRPALPTASPWPRPTLPTGESQGSGTHEAEAAETPLATVSPEELSDIGGDPPPPEGEIDPCTLVTKAEAEEILELPVVEVWRHSHFFGGGNICEWSSDIMAHIDHGEPFSSIFLRLDVGLSEEEFLKIQEELEELGYFPEMRRVAGIGDSAYAQESELDVFKGDTKIGLGVVVNEPWPNLTSSSP